MKNNGNRSEKLTLHVYKASHYTPNGLATHAEEAVTAVEVFPSQTARNLHAYEYYQKAFPSEVRWRLQERYEWEENRIPDAISFEIPPQLSGEETAHKGYLGLVTKRAPLNDPELESILREDFGRWANASRVKTPSRKV